MVVMFGRCGKVGSPDNCCAAGGDNYVGDGDGDGGDDDGGDDDNGNLSIRLRNSVNRKLNRSLVENITSVGGIVFCNSCISFEYLFYIILICYLWHICLLCAAGDCGLGDATPPCNSSILHLTGGRHLAQRPAGKATGQHLTNLVLQD